MNILKFAEIYPNEDSCPGSTHLNFMDKTIEVFIFPKKTPYVKFF